jgi:hypothetical protein
LCVSCVFEQGDYTGHTKSSDTGSGAMRVVPVGETATAVVVDAPNSLRTGWHWRVAGCPKALYLWDSRRTASADGGHNEKEKGQGLDDDTHDCSGISRNLKREEFVREGYSRLCAQPFDGWKREYIPVWKGFKGV